MRKPDKVLMAVEFKESNIEVLIADSLSIDSGVLTVKKG